MVQSVAVAVAVAIPVAAVLAEFFSSNYVVATTVRDLYDPVSSVVRT
jgi:hypothetical protein